MRLGMMEEARLIPAAIVLFKVLRMQ